MYSIEPNLKMGYVQSWNLSLQRALDRNTVVDFRYIGKPIGRVDIPGKVDGSAIFGIDVRVPGMLFAVIARCPHFGGNCTAVTTPRQKLRQE